MRALLLVAALVLSGCHGEGPPGPPDALTIGWLPNPDLPTYSTDPVIAYSTGVGLPCTLGGYVAVHANGNETAVGSPAPITVVASEPPPTGLKTVIFKPLAMSYLCATLTAGDYHARIVAPDGTVLAFGHFTLTP